MKNIYLQLHFPPILLSLTWKRCTWGFTHGNDTGCCPPFSSCNTFICINCNDPRFLLLKSSKLFSHLLAEKVLTFPSRPQAAVNTSLLGHQAPYIAVTKLSYPIHRQKNPLKMGNLWRGNLKESRFPLQNFWLSKTKGDFKKWVSLTFPL